MTSTPFNVGLNDTPRLSSRVLRPPGGGHTDIFGGEPEPPRTGRRAAPNTAITGQGDEPKTTNGSITPTSNGQQTPQEAPIQAQVPAVKQDCPAKTPSPTTAGPEPVRAEAPKRVRVPPDMTDKKEPSRAGMEGGGRQSRLLGRLLGKLRGEHHKYNLDKRFSITSTVMSESTGCGSMTFDDDDIYPGASTIPPNASNTPIDDSQFAANIDLRYGGQYLTPEQLPEFCDQLHHLVEVIRNIQSYANVTGEYPSELERRLEQEAREVASLAAEARNARDVVSRARAQRRAVRAQKKHLVSHLASVRETEVRELESTVRLSDRKLFKSWEALKDSTDSSVFEPLLEEIKTKQTALECLVRLIDSRRSALARAALPPPPLPPPEPKESEEPSTTASGRKRHESGVRRSNYKRRRKDNAKEPRSVPLSSEPSRHGPLPQVTLYIQGTESTSRYRVGSAGAVALTPLDLPSGGSVRDILFFTAN